MYDLALLEAQAKAKSKQKRKGNFAKYYEAKKESLREKKAIIDNILLSGFCMNESYFDRLYRAINREPLRPAKYFDALGNTKQNKNK